MRSVYTTTASDSYPNPAKKKEEYQSDSFTTSLRCLLIHLASPSATQVTSTACSRLIALPFSVNQPTSYASSVPNQTKCTTSYPSTFSTLLPKICIAVCATVRLLIPMWKAFTGSQVAYQGPRNAAVQAEGRLCYAHVLLPGTRMHD